MSLLMLPYYLMQLALGDFKWTLLGMALTLSALGVSRLLGRLTRRRALQVMLAFALVALFVWYGHELIDPLFHRLEAWCNTPLGEPLNIIR